MEVCQVCGERGTLRIEHQWDEEAYAAPGDCHRVQTCRRCGAQQNRGPEHTWSAQEPVAPGACQMTRSCSRCGEQQLLPVSHQWSAVENDPPGSCQWVRACLRCGERDHLEMAYSHPWSQETAEAARPWRKTRVCARCGGREVRLTPSRVSGCVNLLAFARRAALQLSPGFAPPDVIISHTEQPGTASDCARTATCWGSRDAGFRTEEIFGAAEGYYGQQCSVTAYGLPAGYALALDTGEGNLGGPWSQTGLQVVGPEPTVAAIVAAFEAEFGPDPVPANG
jgi:hypothetical protein